MGVRKIQSIVGISITSPAANITLTWKQQPIQGDLLLVIGSIRDDGGAPSPVAGWTVGFQQHSPNTNNYTVVYYKYASAAEPLNFSFDTANRTTIQVVAYEYFGTSGVFVDDVLSSTMNAQALVNGSPPYNTTSFDTSQNNENVIGVFTTGAPTSQSVAQTTTFGTQDESLTQTGGATFGQTALGIISQTAFVADQGSPISATLAGTGAGWFAEYIMVEVANAQPPPPPPPPPPPYYTYMGAIELNLYECPYTLPTVLDANHGSQFQLSSQEPLICYSDINGVLYVAAPGPFDYGYLVDKSAYPSQVLGFSDGYPQGFNYDGETLLLNIAIWASPTAYTDCFQAPLANVGGNENLVANSCPRRYQRIFVPFTSDVTHMNGFGPLVNSPLTIRGVQQHRAFFWANLNEPQIYLGSDNGTSFDLSGMVGTTVPQGFNTPALNIGSDQNATSNISGLLSTNSSSPTGYFFPWSVAGEATIEGGVGPSPSGALNLTGAPLLQSAITAEANIQNAPNFFIFQRGSGRGNEGIGPAIPDPIIFCPQRQQYWTLKLTGMTANTQTIVASNVMQVAWSEASGCFFAIGGGTVIGSTTTIDLQLNFPIVQPPPVLSLPCFNPCVPNLSVSR